VATTTSTLFAVVNSKKKAFANATVMISRTTMNGMASALIWNIMRINGL
jgi:hypothetical protein